MHDFINIASEVEQDNNSSLRLVLIGPVPVIV